MKRFVPQRSLSLSFQVLFLCLYYMNALTPAHSTKGLYSSGGLQQDLFGIPESFNQIYQSRFHQGKCLQI